MNGIAASDKIFRILDQPLNHAEGMQREAKTGDIQLRDLSFSYDEQRVILKHVYMQLRPGQFTAIVGESGSGKSTIAKLIAGIVKDYHGQLLIAGTQRRDIDDDAFYQSFLYVSHQPFIFKGSVRENLAIAKASLSEADMLEALRKVELLDFVMEQGGLDMELQEQGNNLSGGQKQRLSIARALLAQRDVYIFDEAASNIDAKSEDAIISIIHKLAETKTVIMITHRLKSIINCDQIYVIEQGTCQEHGRHEELLHLQGAYAKMYEKQQELEAMEEIYSMDKIGNIRLMARMSLLVKPLAPYMLLAVFLGVTGFLCAIYIPYFSALLISHIAIQAPDFPVSVFFVIMLVLALLRGILHYGEQACNHYIAFKLLAILRDKVFLVLRRLAPAKLEGQDKGNLIYLITSDIEALEVFYAHTISPVLIAVFTSAILLIQFANMHTLFFMIALLGYVSCGVLLPLLITKLGKQEGCQSREGFGSLSSYVLESLRGMQDILQYRIGNRRMEEMQKKVKHFMIQQSV